MQMSSTNECPICSEPFVPTTSSRQAVCLPCGHTACRSCLSRMHSPNCPSCRPPFTGSIPTMAPNYRLHEMLAETSSSGQPVSRSWHTKGTILSGSAPLFGLHGTPTLMSECDHTWYQHSIPSYHASSGCGTGQDSTHTSSPTRISKYVQALCCIGCN